MEENIKSQLKKGVLEFCILEIISRGEVYASEILEQLMNSNMIVVEGTLYPLLSRLRKDGLVDYRWSESLNGPPRRYYVLTNSGLSKLTIYREVWLDINNSINLLTRNPNV